MLIVFLFGVTLLSPLTHAEQPVVVAYQFFADLVRRNGQSDGETVKGWFAYRAGDALDSFNKFTLTKVYLEVNDEPLKIVDAWISQRAPDLAYEAYPEVFQSVRIRTEKGGSGLWIRLPFPVESERASNQQVEILRLPALNAPKETEVNGTAPSDGNTSYNGRFVTENGMQIHPVLPEVEILKTSPMELSIVSLLPGTAQLEYSADLKTWNDIGDTFFIQGEESQIVERPGKQQAHAYYRVKITYTLED